MIKFVVDRGIMPPWFAAPEQGHAISPWVNDRSLGDSEKKDLLAWLSGGTPEGDKKDAPLIRRFEDGWIIGRPDAIFEMPRPIRI